MPIRFVASSVPSYHKRFYSEYGPAEYELVPSPSMDLSFAMRSNPIDSLSFFMLMVKPTPKKVSHTFFTSSFHYQHFLDEDPVEVDEVERGSSSSWKAHLVVFTHPREEKEVDYIFDGRYDHERTIMSPKMM